MDSDKDMPEDSTQIGSDELLSEDNLRLPDSASVLVRLHAVRAWLAEVRQFQQRIIAERGFFPNSTADIAADRSRDE